MTFSMSMIFLEKELLDNKVSGEGYCSDAKSWECSLVPLGSGERTAISPSLTSEEGQQTVAVIDPMTHFLAQGSLARHSLLLEALTNSFISNPVGFAGAIFVDEREVVLVVLDVRESSEERQAAKYLVSSSLCSSGLYMCRV
jgi:hypothetical protein